MSREPLTVQPRPEHIPASLAQQRWWFLDQLHRHSNFNIVCTLRLSGDIATLALSQTINACIARHESLRTVFYVHQGQVCQRVLSPPEMGLSIQDFSSLPDPQVWEQLQQQQTMIR